MKEAIEKLAIQAKEQGEGNAAIVLFTLSAAMHIDGSKELALMCQKFAKEQRDKLIAIQN